MRSLSCIVKTPRTARAFERLHPLVSTLQRSRLVRCLARPACPALAICFAVSTALAQDPPILNSPYVCPNGITYTVTTCKPYRTDQWCETVERQNGNWVTAMDSAWSSMTGRLKGCTNAGNAKPAGTAPGSSASTAAPSSGQQSFNPPYLREFPSVDQIMTQLKGSSPQDTAYRQLTALREFAQMIAALAGPRMAQNQLTPDEARIMTNYFNAYQSLAKTTPNPHDAYAGNNDFTASLFTTFNMPTVQQIWQTSNNMAANQQGGARPLPATNDPAQIAIRRCFELGGTGLQCVGVGMGAGLKQMIGIDVSALTGPGKSGLIVIGTFTSASGLSFDFGDSGVDISNCGKMVQGNHDYSVRASGGSFVVNIANQPLAFVVTIGPDGRATGPAAQDITGQQITGYEVTTNVRTGVVVGRTPVFGPITVHCNVGKLNPGPAVIVDHGLPSSAPTVLSAIGSMIGAVTGASAPDQLSLPPGPRMAGIFTGAGGLKIQFNDGNAVIDCAQAHVLADYSVLMQGNAVALTVKSAGVNPFTLNVQSKGSLAGSGTVTVNGKLMTGMDDNANPIFAPTSASCPLDTLASAK